MELCIAKGLNVDVGKIPCPEAKGAVRHYIEPDNLYTLRPKFAEESIDCIISTDFIFSTKFHRILLKEWMNFCKVGGKIVMVLEDESGDALVRLRQESFELFRNNAEFDWEKNKSRVTVSLKKLKPALAIGDTMERWTFGIITNGKKDGQVDKIAESIIMQKVKEYEIIVCGKYAGKRKRDVKLILFSEKDDRGWITKKKNLLAAAAKYQNIVIVHDRIAFSDGWYEGMKKYGNYFEALACPVLISGRNTRAGDWITYGWDLRLHGCHSVNKENAVGNIYKTPAIGLLDYNDWDEGVYIAGFLNIFKKNVWERCPYNEALFWNEREDIELSALHHKSGIVPRFNPNSICYTGEFRFAEMPTYSFDSQKLGKYNASSFVATRRVLGAVEGLLSSRIFSIGVLAYFSLERALPPARILRRALVRTGVSTITAPPYKVDSIKEGAKLAFENSTITVSVLKQKTVDAAIFEARNTSGETHSYRAMQFHRLFIIRYEK